MNRTILIERKEFNEQFLLQTDCLPNETETLPNVTLKYFQNKQSSKTEQNTQSFLLLEVSTNIFLGVWTNILLGASTSLKPFCNLCEGVFLGSSFSLLDSFRPFLAICGFFFRDYSILIRSHSSLVVWVLLELFWLDFAGTFCCNLWEGAFFVLCFLFCWEFNKQKNRTNRKTEQTEQQNRTEHTKLFVVGSFNKYFLGSLNKLFVGSFNVFLET